MLRGRGNDGPLDRGRGGPLAGPPGPAGGAVPGGNDGGRYKMRQKLASFGDDFDITDARGRVAFKVNGKVLKIANTLEFCTPAGVPLCQLQSKIVTIRDKMDIEAPNGRGAPLGTVTHDLINMVNDRFVLKMNNGPDFIIRGNILGHEYEFYDERSHRQVAEVSRKWFSISDSYGVDIRPGVSEIVILAATVAIDQMVTEKDDARADPVHAGQDVQNVTKTAAVASAPVATATVIGASAAPMPQQVAPLPPGWIQQVDPATGKVFFVNTTVNPPITTWSDPRMGVPQPIPQQPQGVNVVPVVAGITVANAVTSGPPGGGVVAPAVAAAVLPGENPLLKTAAVVNAVTK